MWVGGVVVDSNISQEVASFLLLLNCVQLYLCNYTLYQYSSHLPHGHLAVVGEGVIVPFDGQQVGVQREEDGGREPLLSTHHSLHCTAVYTTCWPPHRQGGMVTYPSSSNTSCDLPYTGEWEQSSAPVSALYSSILGTTIIIYRYLTLCLPDAAGGVAVAGSVDEVDAGVVGEASPAGWPGSDVALHRHLPHAEPAGDHLHRGGGQRGVRPAAHHVILGTNQ